MIELCMCGVKDIVNMPLKFDGTYTICWFCDLVLLCFVSYVIGYWSSSYVQDVTNGKMDGLGNTSKLVDVDGCCWGVV